jgi:hypothetical protein
MSDRIDKLCAAFIAKMQIIQPGIQHSRKFVSCARRHFTTNDTAESARQQSSVLGVLGLQYWAHKWTR